MKIINVRTSSPYNIMIERGSLDRCGELISSALKSKKAVIITDDIVDRLYSQRLVKSLADCDIQADVFVFPNGEQSKNLDTLSDIYDFLCEKNITRSDFLIALGGGVVGDITGFAAASYLRGIDFVQIPTTLLAQVDSSVGGKTAVDIKGGKNEQLNRERQQIRRYSHQRHNNAREIDFSEYICVRYERIRSSA